MFETHIHQQRERVTQHLHQKYNIDFETLPDFASYANVIIGSIISIKIWQNNLKGILTESVYNYIGEIISNLNQILIMGVIGFKIPSIVMLRHSLEKSLTFIYYKDHRIELAKKEYGETKKKFLKLSELKEYIEEYPFYVEYEGINSEKIKYFSKRITKLWEEKYSFLSNYVHGTSLKYFDLQEYLEDLNPDNDRLIFLKENIKFLCDFINALNILFFFIYYKSFEEAEKIFIRNSISVDLGFKKFLVEIFGEL